MIVGNDISYVQNQIDWDIYKDNTNFVIIRSTYGNGYYDSWFAFNRDHARSLNLPRGFYHYAYPEYNNAVDEANWFCKALYDLQEGELLFLDFEEQYSGDVVAWCKTFLDTVQATFGFKPLIYLNQSQTQGYNWQPIVDAGYGLWLASYNPDGIGQTGNWPFMALQQTASNQTVPGTVGYIDRDVFFGDADQFKAYGYHIPVVAPVEQPVQTPIITSPQENSTPAPISANTNPIETPSTPISQVPEQQPVVETPPSQPQKSIIISLLNQILGILKKIFIGNIS